MTWIVKHYFHVFLKYFYGVLHRGKGTRASLGQDHPREGRLTGLDGLSSGLQQIAGSAMFGVLISYP